MKIEKIGSFQSVVNKINKKEKGMSSFLLDTAFLLNSKIQRRVQKQGLDSNGRKMGRYQKRYSIYKSSTGRQTKFRDLTFDGTMWQSLTAVKTGTNKVEMFFGGAEEKAKALGNDKRKPFFSLAPTEQAFLQKELEGFAKL